MSERDKHGQRTPDVSHPASERWVTMDTASDPALMPDLLIPLKLQLCVSVPVFSAVALLSDCINLNEINNFASLIASLMSVASVSMHQLLSCCQALCTSAFLF